MISRLLSPAFVNVVFIALTFVTPLVAFSIYVFFRGRAKNKPLFIRFVILGGLIGPLNLVLWCLYNGVENHFGLDSVKALLINLGVCVILALAVGLTIRSWLSEKNEKEARCNSTNKDNNP